MELLVKIKYLWSYGAPGGVGVGWGCRDRRHRRREQEGGVTPVTPEFGFRKTRFLSTEDIFF